MQAILYRRCRHFIRHLSILTCISFPLFACASDISNTVSHGGERIANGGYFELGATVYGSSQFDVRQPDNTYQPALLISGIYQYHGLFAEMVHQSQDGINLGYNAWNSENWSLDLIFANFQSLWELQDNVDLTGYTEAQRDNYLSNRGNTFIGGGIRATRYWADHYVFQFRLVGDYYDDNGIQSSLRLGKSWQVRNWNLYALGSVNYASDKLVQSMYAVSAEEATSRFPQYKPHSALNYGLELGAAYPITNNVVFRALYRFNLLSDEITDSPFNQSGHVSSFITSVSYVF